MNKENESIGRVEKPSGCITRAQAKALGISGRQVQKPPRPQQNRVVTANSKRVAFDENKPSVLTASVQKRRRATLTDVTNVSCENTYAACFTGWKSKQEKKGPIRKAVKLTPRVPAAMQHEQDVKDKIAQDISKLSVQPQQVGQLAKDDAAGDVSILSEECHKSTTMEDNLPDNPIANDTMESYKVQVIGCLKSEEKANEKTGNADGPSVIDIDNQKDALMCSTYASDIHEAKRVTELKQRPVNDYMEKVQRDTTTSMRALLVDWLVEVSEEYRLVPDTLYLTVNLIDRYLSGNYIERQKLQLLGVTCLLIASKYEEMTAPQAEEFCYITANTYAKEEVLKMERKVLNFLCYQLSVPTTKTFLRRYVYAAQATYEVPLANLELLSNYLAELTLVEYSFLNFLPSLIAASAVFLARWTLDQSVHPWQNPTLEHYTRYRATDLKDAVLAMQNMQLNTSGCPLNAIRDKYRQHKMNCVANMSPSISVESLFSSNKCS